MYQRFTRDARQVVARSLDIAFSPIRVLTEPEHILLSLCQTGLPEGMLEKLGLNYEEFLAVIPPRSLYVYSLERQLSITGQIVMANAEQSATALGQVLVAPEHILLGLLRYCLDHVDSVCSKLFISQATDAATVRTRLERRLSTAVPQTA